jgi:hypothetical protein
LRAWTLAELAEGRITVDDIRNGPPATRALLVGHSGTMGDGQGAGEELVLGPGAPEFFGAIRAYARKETMNRLHYIYREYPKMLTILDGPLIVHCFTEGYAIKGTAS